MAWKSQIPIMWEILNGVFLVTDAELAVVSLIVFF